ncbi:hypothetical protein [Sphingobacterium athyrii]|nr:hypothetical protein [Sphingobacterium athyrii]
MRPCDMVGDMNAKTAELEYWQDIVIKKEDMAAYLGIRSEVSIENSRNYCNYGKRLSNLLRIDVVQKTG